MKIKDYYKEKFYIHYSNCHEDVELLMQYIPAGTKNILSVASALDNSLSFLVHDDIKVDAFDFNPSQIIFGELKKEAIRRLSYVDFLIFIGLKEGNKRKLYDEISPYLDHKTKEYFDKHLYLIDKIGLIHCGRFENYFQIFKNKILPWVVKDKKMKEFMEMEDLNAQYSFYQKHINNIRFRMMFKIFFSQTIMSKAGRDKAFFKYNNGSLAKQVKTRFEQGIGCNLNKDNPYLNYVILNTFNSLPFYLQEKNFLKIKKNIGNIQLYESSFDNMLGKEKYDFMNLSDIFEYMPENVMDEYSDKLLSSLTLNGRIAFWNMMNVRKLNLKRINSSKDLERDRALYYRDFLVYENKYDL